MIRPAKSALPRDRQQFRPRASFVAPWPAAAIVLPDALAHSIATAAAAHDGGDDDELDQTRRLPQRPPRAPAQPQARPKDREAGATPVLLAFLPGTGSGTRHETAKKS